MASSPLVDPSVPVSVVFVCVDIESLTQAGHFPPYVTVLDVCKHPKMSKRLSAKTTQIYVTGNETAQVCDVSDTTSPRSGDESDRAENHHEVFGWYRKQ